jgi:hypothetical protein
LLLFFLFLNYLYSSLAKAAFPFANFAYSHKSVPAPIIRKKACKMAKKSPDRSNFSRCLSVGEMAGEPIIILLSLISYFENISDTGTANPSGSQNSRDSPIANPTHPPPFYAHTSGSQHNILTHTQNINSPPTAEGPQHSPSINSPSIPFIFVHHSHLPRSALCEMGMGTVFWARGNVSQQHRNRGAKAYGREAVELEGGIAPTPSEVGGQRQAPQQNRSRHVVMLASAAAGSRPSTGGQCDESFPSFPLHSP